MENNLLAQQRKKSSTLIMIRLAVSFLFIAAGAGILLGQYLISERNCIPIDAQHPYYMMTAGDYANITTDEHYYSGVYFYSDDEDDPDSYLYFIFLENEIVIVESKEDYRDDQDEQERSFRGVLTKVDFPEDLIENLAYMLEIEEAEAKEYLPYYYISIDKPENTAPWAWGLLILGVAVLGINGMAMYTSKKLKKRMDAYGVDDMAVARFEQELAGGDIDIIGKVTLTKNWLFNKTTGAVALFPLKEVVWVHQTITQTRYNGIPSGKTFALKVYFSDGETMSISGKKAVIEGAVDIFVRRCPHALIGYSPDREKAWAKDRQAVIQVSRQRAAELGIAFAEQQEQDPYADDESRYASTDSYYDRSETSETTEE